MKPISKIDTVFLRDENFVVTDELKRPVFRDISRWIATEKIDGTSMRVGWATAAAIDQIPQRYHVSAVELARVCNPHGTRVYAFVAGKSDNADIPGRLRLHCETIAMRNAERAGEIISEHGLESLTLYGEGYGAGIQKGGGYSDEQRFALFDVRADSTYLAEHVVDVYALQFEVERVPAMGVFTFDEMVALAKQGFKSELAQDQDLDAEGLVGRTAEPLYDARGNRLIVKLKTKDWAPSSPKPDRRP